MTGSDIRRNFLVRMHSGLEALIKSRIGIIIMIVYTIFMLGCLSYLHHLLLTVTIVEYYTVYLTIILFWMLLPAGLVLIILLYSQPIKAYTTQEHLRSAGIVSHTARPPMLKRFEIDKDGSTRIYVLKTDGISTEAMKKKAEEIQSALNIIILNISKGKTENEVIIVGVPGAQQLPKEIYWRDSYLASDPAELVLGVGHAGPIKASFNDYAHFLLCGQTGSGKTMLLQSLLYQCIRHGDSVTIADFKGGGDYGAEWETFAVFKNTKEELRDHLDLLVSEIENRKKLFHIAETANIGKYNSKTGVKLPRYILASDEAADMLTRDDDSKAAKEIQADIISNIAFIARQGRAFGVHLILAIQRPDADIIKGQIKSNLGYRICGRADQILSQMVLDTSEYSDFLHDAPPGIFFNHKGEEFKGFLLDSESPFWCDYTLM